MKVKTAREKEVEDQIKSLSRLFESQGIAVRRENLARGSSFRVKSGDCVLAGQPHVFVDRRLPREQQVSLLLDYLLEFHLELPEDEIEKLPRTVRDLFHTKRANESQAIVA